MNINWKIRTKNLSFWIGLVGVIASPILAYYGMVASDFTTWDSLGDVLAKFITNPYLVFTVIAALLGALGVTVDPTTSGIKDSERAMSYGHDDE